MGRKVTIRIEGKTLNQVAIENNMTEKAVYGKYYRGAKTIKDIVKSNRSNVQNSKAFEKEYGMTFAEYGRRNGVPECTVRSRYNRGLDLIKGVHPKLYAGKTMKEWKKLSGKTQNTIYYRWCKHGDDLTLEHLTPPSQKDKDRDALQGAPIPLDPPKANKTRHQRVLEALAKERNRA